MCFLVAAWYAAFAFTASTYWPDEIQISRNHLHGRHNYKEFSIPTKDISSIFTSQGGKSGPGLHVDTMSSKRATNIPIIWGEKKASYQQALREICPPDKAFLSW
jgi:hypothetical protein